jgi:hypothetical protein
LARSYIIVKFLFNHCQISVKLFFHFFHSLLIIT